MNSEFILEKLYRNVADYGLATAATKSVRYLLRPIYENIEYRTYGMDVQTADLPEDDDPRFTYRLLTPGDAAAIRQIERQANWLRGGLAARLRDGSLCLVAIAGDSVVAFNLVSFGAVFIPLVHLRWTFRAGEAWSEQISTSRDWRRQGLASRLRYRVARTLRDKGFTWFYGGTLPQHHAALLLARRVGFVELGSIYYRRVVNRRSWSFEENAYADSRAHPRPFDDFGLLSADKLSVQSSPYNP